MIEPIHIPDVNRVARPAASDDRQPQQRRQHQRRQRDTSPKIKLYTPDGNIEEQEGPRIELVG